MKAIVITDRTGAIAKDGKQICEMAPDRRYFRSVTDGKTVIMGRRTAEAIGRPLPNRHNVVLSRNDHPQLPVGFDVRHSADDMFRSASESDANRIADAFVIGGAEVYRMFAPCITELHLTVVDHVYKGDQFYPCFHGLLVDQNWTDHHRVAYGEAVDQFGNMVRFNITVWHRELRPYNFYKYGTNIIVGGEWQNGTREHTGVPRIL